MNQTEFLQKIEDILPKSTNLAAELADVLDISIDSAYRRIRIETQLNLDEITKLCKHFSISFDVFNDSDFNNVTFGFQNIKYEEESFETYLDVMIKDLTLIRQAPDSRIVYACEDIPIFYNYKYPNLSAFKMFYWREAILNHGTTPEEKFSTQNSNPELVRKGKIIFDLYMDIPSTEIWTDTTFLSLLKQLDYFWQSGKIASAADAQLILEDIEQLMKDIKLQAECGHKLSFSDTEKGVKAEYNLFLSDVEIGNNCVLVDLGHVKAVYIGHLSFNTISTMNIKYTSLTENWLNNIIRKSSAISKVAEKQRFQYFNMIMKKVNEMKAQVI